MKFKEAHDKAKTGEKITYGYLSCTVTKKNGSSAICWDDKTPLHYNELFEKGTWFIINKIKVTIDGKEGYISKESAEELKKMLA